MTQSGHRQDRNSAVHRNLAVSAASPAAATQFGRVPRFSPSAQSQRPAAAGLSRDGSNKATIAAFLAQQARSFEISLLRPRNQEKSPDHRLENRDTDGGRKEAQFPVVRQAIEKDIMIKDFNVSEKGHGSYWLLGILRWVMVLIFVSFGIQKFTPQSADGIALYISNSPFVSWLSIFGIRGEAYLLGIIELTTAALLAAGAFIPILSALAIPIDGAWYVCDYVVVFLLDARCREMERIHRSNSVEPHRGILVQRCRPSLCLYRVVFGITAKESRPPSVELMSRCWRGDSRLSN
jgi:hypothetical protein